MLVFFFIFKLYAFILLTSTLVPGINYFVVTTHPIFVLMAEGWLRDSGPINFFWDQIGPSILRSHVDERLYFFLNCMLLLY